MNLQPLLVWLADGQFHSGQILGERLGISRAAVWKQIHALKDLGVEIYAVPGRGYRIPDGLDLLDKQRIVDTLTGEAQSVAANFQLHLSIDSTNTEAMRQAIDGAASALVIAEHQMSGRGRRGKTWVSPFGHNLYMSLVWSFQGGVAALEGLSLVCGLAVVRALRGQGYAGFELKWPNDVLYQGRKLAGILLEVTGDLTGACRVIVGIGVNTRLPVAAGKAIDQPYSELATISAKQVDRNELAAGLINELFACLAVFSEQGFKPFRQEWIALDRYHGADVEIRAGRQVMTGRAVGVDELGRLLLESDQGRVTITGGELMPSLRPLSDTSQRSGVGEG